MPKPTAQACHAMTTYYIGRYEETNGEKPNVNRNKARYLFESLLYDYSAEEVKALLDYFVKHYTQELEWFQWNYEKVLDAKRDHDKNESILAERRKVTAQRLAEWKKRKEEWQKK